MKRNEMKKVKEMNFNTLRYEKKQKKSTILKISRKLILHKDNELTKKKKNFKQFSAHFFFHSK